MGRTKNLEQRENIIRTTYLLCCQSGYEKVTTRYIAEQCNISRALLHYYFPKKNAITIEILKKMQDHLTVFIGETFNIHMDNLTFGIYCPAILLKVLHQKNLFTMFIQTCDDPTLLNELIMDQYSLGYVYDDKHYINKIGKGMFIFMGIYMQLNRCRECGLIEDSILEIEDLTQQLRYLYLGWDPQKIADTIADVNKHVTPELINTFIDYYEDLLNWK